ncbi:DMT family transporter [Aestuariivirga litoralis]|uniref:DMT family transporter n=1 Tax=Aestuariivirga litoralis TaxID=2650924 RepID=UPI0018C64E19|nr:DMT family transporter [Aestuariivirga litoralis]MBG1231874.1 DMT family transporter [Aestuariivirga litoralis]
MFLSESLAIGAAIAIALSAMFTAALHNRIPLFQLVRWQLSASFVMTSIGATLNGGWGTLGHWQILALMASGVAGIVLASTTYFATILTVGPRLTALLFSLTSPFALFLGYLALGETIDLKQGFGIVLILIGLAVAVGLPSPHAAPDALGSDENAPKPLPVAKARPWLGIGLGVVTAIGQALGTLLARPAMASGVEPFAAMSVRISLAVVFFWALAALPQIRKQDAAFRVKDFSIIAASAFSGTTVGMVLLMAALKLGNVGIVSTLSSITPVVILPMVWIVSRKMPSAMAWCGAVLAVIGTAVISLN